MHLGLAGWYEQFRRAQLGDWMLYLVRERDVRTRADLVAQARQAIDFSDHPMLRELGVDRAPRADGMIERGVQTLFDRGWLVEDVRLSLTDAGSERLGKRMREGKREHGWLRLKL